MAGPPYGAGTTTDIEGNPWQDDGTGFIDLHGRAESPQDSVRPEDRATEGAAGGPTSNEPNLATVTTGEAATPVDASVSQASASSSRPQSSPSGTRTPVSVSAVDSASSPSSFPLERTPSSQEPATCLAVLLVSFDHALGPIIEFSHPNKFQLDPELNKTLPFLALPDGCHAREEDYSYFHMHNPTVAPGTLFGISCNRQIQAEQLLNKDKTVTRSTVQKAIVVLASKPIFGALRDKLGVVTRTFFAQRDFADKSILVDLYTSFKTPRSVRDLEQDEKEGTEMYMGTSLRELVHKFRHKTLMLLKLLMMQRRASYSVMFYSSTSTVEALCTLQYSLVALIPALMHNLQDAAIPNLDARSKAVSEPTSLKTSDKASLIRYLGLPLNVFGQGAFFQPYLPLQQIDFLQCRSYLVGTTNSIFQQQRDCRIDVVVRIDNGTLDILNPKLQPLLALTAADRKWMDEIISTVDTTWSPADPQRPQTTFIGSEDFLRAKFEEYVCSALASIKFIDYIKTADRRDVLLSQEDINSYNMSSWNELFIRQFRATPAFELWNRTTDAAIFDLVEPRHPMEGRTNPIEDVGIRLAHGLQDLHLQENLAPTREAIARGLSTGSEHLLGAYSFLRSDLSKRTQEFHERRSSYASTSSATGSAIETTVAPVQASVWAGVDVAKSGAASLATGLGSFLTSRWAPKRTASGSAGSDFDRKLSRTPSPGGPTVASQISTDSSSVFDNQKEDPSLYLRPLVTAPLSTKSSPSTSPATTPGLSAGPSAASTSSGGTVSAAGGGILGSINSFRKSWIEGPQPSAGSIASGPASVVNQQRRPSQLKELELLDPNSTAMSREVSSEDQAAREARLAKRRERELAAAEAKLNGLPTPPSPLS
ncbi:hypothetical protein OIV83_003238 [Microbotryomycetes sp. JL201]|nr:hypothetical protein OIV83_003238 [Microbotryomycetes sp. JL201]